MGKSSSKLGLRWPCSSRESVLVEIPVSDESSDNGMLLRSRIRRSLEGIRSSVAAIAGMESMPSRLNVYPGFGNDCCCWCCSW